MSAEQTNDRIQELLPPGSIDAQTRLVLTNAIYLLADWHHQFDPDDTVQRPFTGLDGHSEQVAMMSQTEDFPYARVDGHQLVELPYAGEELSMVVLLPYEEHFEYFERNLDADRLTALLEKLRTFEVELSMPRFEVEGVYDLLELLHERMGMPVDGFDGIAPGLFIDGIYHDAFVSVDEKGTEAAAVTGWSGVESGPQLMRVDRPFLFLIRDRPTGAILFLGRVVQPPEEA